MVSFELYNGFNIGLERSEEIIDVVLGTNKLTNEEIIMVLSFKGFIINLGFIRISIGTENVYNFTEMAEKGAD